MWECCSGGRSGSALDRNRSNPARCVVSGGIISDVLRRALRNGGSRVYPTMGEFCTAREFSISSSRDVAALLALSSSLLSAADRPALFTSAPTPCVRPLTATVCRLRLSIGRVQG